MLSGKQIPVIPRLPSDYDPYKDLDPNPTVAICGECGLHLKAVMGYVCSNACCPTGLGGSRNTV